MCPKRIHGLFYLRKEMEMKKFYMLLAGFLIMFISGCSGSGGGAIDSSGGGGGGGSNDYTSTYIGTLKYVPAGSFQRDDGPLNISTVSAFRMSEYEITREQFEAVTGLDNPSDVFAYVINGPVQKTNWYHALVFCNMLSMREGLEPVYSIMVSGTANTDPADWIVDNGAKIPISSNATWDAATADWTASGYRLPTEMEWMWAAMGAKDGTTGYIKGYAGSTEAGGAQVNIGNYVWYFDNSDLRTHTVGRKLPNELGIYYMSGNVIEWCWDWYGDPYPTGLLTNYLGAASGPYRVVRGGSWSSRASYATVADRVICVPSNQAFNIWFLVVRN